ncbi:uncharacterized protein LOC116171894 [Photinus pyralis]|uniref:uncharacterized protein LOC116171894 n=1 Tax=Photinus pyralis TaxID=7054 RepID=UPI00126714D2|nr:uncharacterized protein LOC116171894 [Photinus pyralis]
MTVIAQIVVLFLVHIYSPSACIFPLSYNVSFKNEETFIISDIEHDENDDVYQAEDEMLKEDEVNEQNLEVDSKHFKKLHQISSNYNNKKEFQYNSKLKLKPKEHFQSANDEEPWETSIIYPNDNGTNDKRNYKIRQTHDKEDYNYDALKVEYDNDIKKEEKSKKTLKYSDTKEEESFNDAINAVVHPVQQNCTVEQQKGIGLSAVQCLMTDIMDPKTNKAKRSELLNRVKKLILIWIAMYLIIAIPCWCQRGWCCCCFQCSTCKPHQNIDKAKKFLMDNPPGTYKESAKKVITYKPTHYEKYAYKNLEKALLNL